MIDTTIASLVAYAERTGLIEPCERNWAVNTLLEALKLDSYPAPETPVSGDIDLAAVLGELMDDAHARGVLPEDSVVYRDLFDTMLMGRLTPRPGSLVKTAEGPGVVTEANVITGRLKVSLQKDEAAPPKVFQREDVTVIRAGKARDGGRQGGHKGDKKVAE